jgi:hypothetical protein
MIIGILLLGAIAAGYSAYDNRRIKKQNEETAANEKRIAEETMRAFHAENPQDLPEPEGAEEDPRGVTIADLAEYSLRQGMNPFLQLMRYASRNEDYNVAAVDSYDNIYIIETQQNPKYADMLQQIRADVDHYRTRMQKHKNKRKIYVYICTNHPTDQLREAIEDDPDVKIFNYRIRFRTYKEKVSRING